MLTRFRAAGLLWPTIASVAGLVVLISLGNWQMSRKAWKEELIARLAAGAAAAPVPLAVALQDPAPIGFRRVTATGTLEHQKELHLWAGDARGPAWSVVTPLRLSQPISAGRRQPIEWVLVIRGSVPQSQKSAAARASGQIAGEVTVTGRIRLDEGRNWAAGAPNMARNEWYARDLAAMRAHLLGAAGSASVDDQAGRIAPVFVEAEAALGGEGAPQPQLSALQLPNRHLEYALTWYGLALTLAAVFIAFAHGRLRRVSSEAPQ